MATCKLKKGDRIYECKYHRSVLTELLTDPVMEIQHDGVRFWKWTAKIVETGDVVEFGISEKNYHYGPYLYRKDYYQLGEDAAERVLPPFDTQEEKVALIQRVPIDGDVEILGHVFHGLEDIKEYVEMSLYKSYDRGKAGEWEPKKKCEVHVGEMWMPYPCFDFEDSVNENRSYSNFIFRRRPLTQDDMRRLSELPSARTECRITDDVPQDMLPLLYYFGEGNEMLLMA